MQTLHQCAANRRQGKVFGKVLGAIAVAMFSLAAHAGPGSIVTFGQSGNVKATLTGSSGAYGHLLDIASTSGTVTAPIFAIQPGGGNPGGFAATPIGTTVDLGAYVAGSELEFRLTDVYPGVDMQLFTGPGSRNANGLIYANVTFVDATTVDVAFNDLVGYPFQQSFDNLLFELTLLPDTTTGAVPEPASIALLSLGLLGIAALRRPS